MSCQQERRGHENLPSSSVPEEKMRRKTPLSSPPLQRLTVTRLSPSPSFRSPPSCGGVSSPRSRHLVVTQTLTKRQQFRKWRLSKLCSYIHRFVIQSGLCRTWWDKACCTFPVWLLEALIGRIFIDPFVLTGSSPWLCFQAVMKCGLSVTVTKLLEKNQVLCCFRATPGKETYESFLCSHISNTFHPLRVGVRA